MRTWLLATGAAALAIGGPALAHNHGGKGGGGKPDHSAHAKAEGGGGAPAQARGKADRPDRANRRAQQVQPNRGRADSPRIAKIDDGPRGKGGEDRANRANEAGARLVRRDLDANLVRGARTPFDCPPGLDRKDNGCLPPGQAMKLVGAPLATAFTGSLLPMQYRSWYPDSDDYYFRSGDGFIYRVNRSNDLVDGLIPLFGSGYYALGDPWPQPYNFYNVPSQYRDYWSDGDNYLYRYGDGAIYRLDPKTQAVNAIVALLAGDLGVGSRLPATYDVYNVPLAYRSQYYDTADNWYRYNDGYIYRVDPTTRLITAVIDAIV